MNWRRIAVAGLITGMVAITGCSSNLPETNQGNRNGQRVADSINRREDTYRTTSHRLRSTENTGRTGHYGNRVTRGIHRAANNITGTTRNASNITKNTHGRYNHTYGRNRSLSLGRPQGRIGNTFSYNNHRGYANGLNTNINHGYDMGVTASEQAMVNSRITRSSVTAPEAMVVPNEAVSSPVITNPTRRAASTEKTATKPVETKRKADVKPIDTKRKAKKVETKTETKAHESSPSRTNHARVNTAPKVALQPITQRPRNIRANHVAPNATVQRSTRATHSNNQQVKHSNKRVSRYGMNANRTVKNNDVKRTNIGITPNTKVNRTINTNINRTNNGYYSTQDIGLNTNMMQTVAVVNHDDINITNDEMAFFRKKTEEPTTPTTPEMPAPAEPAPTGLEESYDDNYENNYDDSDTNNNNDDTDNATEDNNLPQPVPSTPRYPARTVTQRLMK